MVDLHSCLDPVHKGIARTDDPKENEYRSGYDHEPCKLTMWTVEYVSYFTQNMKDFDYLTKKAAIIDAVSTKIVIFERLFGELVKFLKQYSL